MTCKHCGYPIGSSPRFCPSCGMPVEAEDAPRGEAPETAEYFDAYDLDDPVERLKTRSRSAYSTVSRRVNRNMDRYALRGWQTGVAVAVAVGGCFFLLALLFGMPGAALGLLACGAMAWNVWKSPKFDALGMLLPVALFAMAYGTVGLRTVLSQASPGASLLSALGGMLELFGVGLSMGPSFGYGFIDLVVRLLWYAVAVGYGLFLIGKNRETAATCYGMMGVCGVTALYDLAGALRNLLLGFGASMFHLGSLAFAASLLVFALYAPKPKRTKKATSNEKLFRRLVRVVPSEYADYDFSEYHPYYTLGGWLKAVVILLYIGAAVTAVSGVAQAFALGAGSFYMGALGVGAFRSALAILAGIAYAALAAFLSVRVAQKIVRRDDHFLLLYHVLCLMSLAVSFMIDCARTGFLAALVALIPAGLGAFLLTLYFCRSVRVRSYMLSDEYMRLSPLTRKLPSPEPEE